MAIITDIVQTRKNNSQMYEVFIDCESIGYYHIEILVKHGFKVGSEIDKETMENVLVESSTVVAMEKVLNLISKTMKTEKDIKIYLLGKGYNEKIVDRVIGKLKEYNYVNDEIYGKYYISGHGKTCGSKKLKYDLIKKGIDESVVQKLLDETEEDLQVIKTLADKYLKGKQMDIKTKSKLFKFLYGKGFEYENINKIISSYNWSSQNEDWV